MKVLVACEFSGIVRQAFRDRGHDAWSCDLIPALDGSPHHFIQDALKVADALNWDLLIAHPPCTRLTVAGARWFKGREQEQEESIRFAESLWAFHHIPKICIENPIGVLSTKSELGKPSQIIQPFEFGHGERKATCLWLKGVPLLNPTNIVDGRVPRVHHESPGIKDGLTRAQRRSLTYKGIATAMADQWG